MDLQGWAERGAFYVRQQYAAVQQRQAQAQQRYAVSQVATGYQEVREYRGASAVQQGIRAMAYQGYRVASQSSYQPRSGCLRTIALGFIGALVWKPKPRFVVTFTRG